MYVSYDVLWCIIVLLDLVLALVSYVYACRTYVVDAVVFFQAEDGIRDLVRSRGLGDVYKRQALSLCQPVSVSGCLIVIPQWHESVFSSKDGTLQLSLIHI